MFNILMIFVLSLGLVPLFTGCGICVCKQEKTAKMPAPLEKNNQNNARQTATPMPTSTMPEPQVLVPTETETSATPLPEVLEPKTPGADIKSEAELNQLIQFPTVVYFNADWCNACYQITPLFNQIAQESASKCNFVRVNVDKFRTLATGTYNITAIPTILFFNNGKELTTVGRLISSDITKEQFTQTIKSAFEEQLQK